MEREKYYGVKLVAEEIRTEQAEVSKAERIVRNWSVHSQRASHYAFTCFSALSKYMEYYISYPSVHVYSSNPEELSKGLVWGRCDIVVHILRPDSELIFRNTRLMKDLAIVEPIQIVVDMFCLGGAGRGGAMKLYQSLTESKNAKKQKDFQSKGDITRGKIRTATRSSFLS